MNLRETLKLMYVNEASGERNIKLKEYWNTGNGRIVYNGRLKDFLSYILIFYPPTSYFQSFICNQNYHFIIISLLKNKSHQIVTSVDL